MFIVIVYDSIFGNTKQVAEAIGGALEPHGTVRLVPVSDSGEVDLDGIDLLIVGSPTRGFAPTPAIHEFDEGLDVAAAAGRKAAAFDTRLDPEDIHPAPLRWVVNAGGYAADRIANSLTRKGFALTGTPGGFKVGGTEGPLKPGELDRARVWAAGLLG